MKFPVETIGLDNNGRLTMDFTGERVAIMGGSSGIGRATATLLAEHGAEVIVTGRSPEKLADVVTAVPAISTERIDVTDRHALDALYARLGLFDHLVVCISAGGGGGPFASLDLNALRSAFAAKTFAQLDVVQAALPTLRRGGSVTLVTAASARAALPGTVGLAAVNGALEAAVRPLATELAPTRVNAVSPGVVETSWWASMPERQRAAFFVDMAGRIPAGRIAQPDEIAMTIMMLVASTFVTGHVVVADGGLHLAK
jgi:NAD(P)-dependent dehydrogenase (short-subunit alcohol dehydrogenase family)